MSPLVTIYWRAAAEILAESTRQRSRGNLGLAERMHRDARTYRRIACAPDPAAALWAAEAEMARKAVP